MISLPLASLLTEPVGIAHYLVVGAVLFVCGALCMATKRNAIGVLMGVRYVPAAALGGLFMAVVPDVLTRYGHGAFMGRVYDISNDWFQIALGLLLIAQLILLPDGVWGDLRNHAARIRSALPGAARKQVRPA